MSVEESSGAQPEYHRCEVCYLAGAREFTDANRARCRSLAPWLRFVCDRCIKRFGLKYQMSEVRATAKAAEKTKS